MQAIHETVASPTYTELKTSYPGPYNLYQNCPSHRLTNVHDPNILTNYYGTSGYCSFSNLHSAKNYCNTNKNCTGVSGAISSDGFYIPVTGGIPTLGGVSMNGSANVFYHKV